MLEFEEGQIYTFDKGKTYQIINHIEDDNDVWYQLWSKEENSLWNKIYPNEIVFIDIDFISKYDFEKLFNEYGKYIGKMNKEYALNNNWNLVKKKKATKLWFKMENIG